MNERLTHKNKYGRWVVDFHGLDGRVIKELHGVEIDRLAAYEDSGLTPQEVQELTKAKQEGRLVKRGKWIYEHEWKCSSCGWAQSHDFNTLSNDILKYCPNCGAKMSKEEAEKALREGLE